MKSIQQTKYLRKKEEKENQIPEKKEEEKETKYLRKRRKRENQIHEKKRKKETKYLRKKYLRNFFSLFCSPHVLLQCDHIPTVLPNHRHVAIGTGGLQHLLHLQIQHSISTENFFRVRLVETVLHRIFSSIRLIYDGL